MFKDDAFGFSTIIAYIVPGFVTLLGLSFFSEPVRILIANATQSKAGVGPITLILLASLPCGMIISVVRGSTIDHTFRLNFKRFLPFLYSHYDRLEKVEPVLASATRELPLEVVQEIRNRFHSPFQFYGNISVALAFVGLGQVYKLGLSSISTAFLPTVGYVLLFIMLYSAARGSYARTLDALKKSENETI